MSRHEKEGIFITVFCLIFVIIVFAFGYAMGSHDAAVYAVERFK